MSNNKFLFLPLYLLIFLDSLGASMISPLISPLFYQSSGLILHLSMHGRTIDYGFSAGIYFVMLIFGAPIIGSLSDHFGRKKLLALCLVGSIVGYFLTITAIHFHMLSIFIFGRMIDGFTAGTLALAQASIADMSKNRNKARDLGYMFTALSLGYLIGPLFSSLLAHITINTPFYMVIFLSLINLFMLLILFKETRKASTHEPMELSPVKNMGILFKNKLIAKLFICFALMQLYWAFYIQNIPIYLTQAFKFTSTHIGIFMALISFGFLIGSSMLIPLLSKHFQRENIVKVSFIFSLILVLCVAVFQNVALTWFTSMAVAILLAVGYANITASISDKSPANLQGLMMGNIASVSGSAFALGPIIGAMLATIKVSMPIYTSALCILGAIISLHYTSKKAFEHDKS